MDSPGGIWGTSRQERRPPWALSQGNRPATLGTAPGLSEQNLVWRNSTKVDRLVPVRQYDTVLVVDDDGDVRRSCAEVLRTAGYRVVEAESGLGAVEHLKSSHVDVVLLDVFMPGLDGLSVLDQIEHPPPVALLTAHEYDDEIVARRSKVSMYIQKPIAPLALLEAVARMFAGA